MSKSGVAALGPTCQLLQQMSKPGVAAPLDTGQRRDRQGHSGKGQRAVAGHGGRGRGRGGGRGGGGGQVLGGPGVDAGMSGQQSGQGGQDRSE